LQSRDSCVVEFKPPTPEIVKVARRIEQHGESIAQARELVSACKKRLAEAEQGLSLALLNHTENRVRLAELSQPPQSLH
jgi:exonuclease VII small subunit